MKVSITEKDTKQKDKKVVGTYINTDVYDYLKQLADDEFISVSDILRKIIYSYYKKHILEDNAKLKEENK